MLGYDTYLLLMALPLMMGAVLFLECESPTGVAVLFDGTTVAFSDTDNPCCCCPACSAGCNVGPRRWGTVEFSNVVDTEIVPPPSAVYACAAGSGDESEKICEEANPGLNNTSFEVECRQLDECSYVDTGYSGDYCGLDNIEVDLYIDWHSTGEGVLINIHDDEPSPADYAWFFEKPSSYPINCHVVQTPDYDEQGDEICDFSGATAEFTPYCDQP